MELMMVGKEVLHPLGIATTFVEVVSVKGIVSTVLVRMGCTADFL
jgi:hypothetical protein